MRRVLVSTLLLALAAPAAGADNRPPTCSGDSFSGVAGVGFQVRCSDPDGDPLAYEVVTPPAHGTLTQPEGDAHFSYTPATGFHGEDTLAIRARDTQGAASEAATITIRIDRPPPECGAVMDIRVMAGYGAGSGMCQAERMELTTPPQHGAVSFTLSHDIWHPAYDADPGAGGTTDLFAFKAVNADGASPEYTVHVTIAPAPTPYPAATAAPVLAAPVIHARALTRSRRAAVRHGLRLAVGCDVACAATVAVGHGRRTAGAAAGSGRLTVRLDAATRRALRGHRRVALEVTVVATAAGRPPSALSFTAVLR
jgi:hypothetical protein